MEFFVNTLVHYSGPKGSRVREVMGYYITALVGGMMDTPYERIAHPAVFQNVSEAAQFADRISKKLRARPYNGHEGLDFGKWILNPADDLVSGYRLMPGQENPAFYSPVDTRTAQE